MLPENIKQKLKEEVARSAHPHERAIDVMFELQAYYGYMSDQAVHESSGILGMSTLEIEGLATFYDFIFREPVGKNLIQVCDSTVCWLHGLDRVLDHLYRRLNIRPGQTTPDGMFSLLPTPCPGYCDHAPAMMVNRKVYGRLTPQKIDEILARCRAASQGPQEKPL